MRSEGLKVRSLKVWRSGRRILSREVGSANESLDCKTARLQDQGLALRNDPVGHFSQGARLLQGSLRRKTDPARATEKTKRITEINI